MLVSEWHDCNPQIIGLQWVDFNQQNIGKWMTWLKPTNYGIVMGMILTNNLLDF